MTTSTLSRPSSERSENRRPRRESRLHAPKRIRRMQERGAVMVHRHALPSVALSMGAGLVAGLVVGGLLYQAIESRREPETFFKRSRRRMGDTLSNLSDMVPTNYREWRR